MAAPTPAEVACAIIKTWECSIAVVPLSGTVYGDSTSGQNRHWQLQSTACDIAVNEQGDIMKIIPFCLILSLSGCATWFPAAVNEIDDGVYTITATGGSFTAPETLKAKVDKKAESLCKDKGYSYRQNAATDWKQQKDYSTGVTTNYQQMHITIECNK